MKKSKRLEIVSTIVKKHKIYKKEQIISYIEEYFGVRYSATTIAKDLKELNIYRVPIDCETWIYKAINNQTEQEMREKFKHYCEHEVLSSIINGAYIIVKTSPGFAQGINYFIDQLNIEEILGTVSGNDTTLILTASNDMALFLVLNAACIQLVPSTIISIRAASGSNNPGIIILPALISTSVAALVGVICCKILQRYF